MGTLASFPMGFRLSLLVAAVLAVGSAHGQVQINPQPGTLDRVFAHPAVSSSVPVPVAPKNQPVLTTVVRPVPSSESHRPSEPAHSVAVSEDATSMSLVKISNEFLRSLPSEKADWGSFLAEDVVVVPAVRDLGLTEGLEGFKSCRARYASLFAMEGVHCELTGVDPLRGSVIARCTAASATYRPSNQRAENLDFAVFMHFNSNNKISRVVFVDESGTFNSLVQTPAEAALTRLVAAGFSFPRGRHHGNGGWWEGNHHRRGERPLPGQHHKGGHGRPHHPFFGFGPKFHGGKHAAESSGRDRHHGGLMSEGLDQLVDDQVVLRFHNLPAAMSALVDGKQEFVGKRELEFAARRVLGFGRMLRVRPRDVDYRKVFADDNTVVIHVSAASKCSFAIKYTFDEQGTLIQKDVYYLGRF